MKKQILIITALLSLFMIGSVFAWVGESESFNVVQKNPSDWSVVSGGYSSTLYFSQSLKAVWVPCYGGTVSCKTYVPVDYVSVVPTGKVKPNTDYTLVYYGFGSHNDEWNYVTCIASKNSGSYGYLNMKGQFDWSGMVDDGLNQKFWIVPSSNLDCDNNRFNSWNPTEILFETQTI